MAAQAFDCSVLTVDKHDDILDFESSFFQQCCRFQNTTTACDQIIDDERRFARGITTLDAAFPCSLRVCSCVDERYIRFKRICRCQQQSTHWYACNDGKGMNAWPTERLCQIDFLLHQLTCNTQCGWVADKHLGINKDRRANSRFAHRKVSKFYCTQVEQRLCQPEIVERLLFRHLDILSLLKSISGTSISHGQMCAKCAELSRKAATTLTVTREKPYNLKNAIDVYKIDIPFVDEE